MTGAQLEKIPLSALDLAHRQDDRRFLLAKEQFAVSNRNDTVKVCLGTVIALAGLGAVVYLASIGQATAAGDACVRDCWEEGSIDYSVKAYY
ncbi:MAG: hypothetical protein ABSF98_23235 [Bryobacteraceae bacterium]